MAIDWTKVSITDAPSPAKAKPALPAKRASTWGHPGTRRERPEEPTKSQLRAMLQEAVINTGGSK